MRLSHVSAELDLDALATPEPDREVRGGYCSDLLSDVLAHAQPGDLWITYQRHLNVVAVAKLREAAGVVIVRGMRPAPEVIARAQAEGVNLLLTAHTAFETAGRLYALLHR